MQLGVVLVAHAVSNAVGVHPIDVDVASALQLVATVPSA